MTTIELNAKKAGFAVSDELDYKLETARAGDTISGKTNCDAEGIEGVVGELVGKALVEYNPALGSVIRGRIKFLCTLKCKDCPFFN